MFTNLLKEKILLTLPLLILLTGCGVWDNFITYFNLYYNANELYTKIEKQITDQKKDLFSIEPPAIPPAANADVQKLIEKCSVILQFHSTTSYVDEALLMLGKAFYYQRNYLKSQQKFKELLAADPEGEYALESQLWIGKCDMRLRNYADGLAQLKEVRDIAIEEDEEEIMEQAYIEEIVYRKTIEDIPAAIQVANEFLEISENETINAELWYEVGNLNMQIGDSQSAVVAFQNVFEHSPSYDLEVSANLKLGSALRTIGETEKAYEIFTNMRSEDKYADKYSDIDLEIGITENALGNYEAAINQLIMVDTTYKNTPVAGAAKYEIGNVYEHGIKLLDSAAVFYQKASTSSLPKEYILPAKEKQRLFSRYVLIKNDLNKYGKQLFYLQNPDQFSLDSMKYVQDSLAIAEEIAEVKELQESWSGLETLLLGESDTTGFFMDSLKVADTLIVYLKDSLEYINRDTIFSKIRNPLPEDSLLVAQFDSMFTNRTFDPNAKVIFEQKKREREALANQLIAALPDTLKFKNNPPRKPKISEDSLKTLLAKNQLELGNLFLSEFDLPDSAYKYYHSNLTEYPDNSFYATSMFAMGSYYLTVDNQKSADSLFNIIYENYKNENIVNAAAVKLNKPLIDLNYDPAVDEYKLAEEFLLEGDYYSAIDKLKEIPKQYPKSTVAPKAIYASGWIEENELKDYSAAVTSYDTLIAKYPASEYVRIVAPKVTAYKQEKRKQETALLDSLNALTSSDSMEANNIIPEEILVPQQDTIQVALEDEQQTVEQKETVTEQKKLPVNKEPVWNPRRRR
ncbi:MAG: tetratricopeptide repeat protein [bacterium]|nr:tetratricopeptide repeat protein [bacterium]